jgi:hypothetical protein
MELTDPIVRHVEWFYRHTIKDPPDSIRELAQEFRLTDAAIEAGIQDAFDTLNQAAELYNNGTLRIG